MTLGVEGLDPARHERSGFRCGNTSLDERLRVFAHQNDTKHNTGRTWVAVDDDTAGVRGRVPIMGYVTIAAHGVGLAELREVLPGGSLPDPTPAALIGRLAVDRREQGRHLGGRLLRFAVEKVLAADAHLAIPFVVVEAIDENAARFYEHHGFLRVPDSGRLLARTSDLAAAFDL